MWKFVLNLLLVGLYLGVNSDDANYVLDGTSEGYIEDLDGDFEIIVPVSDAKSNVESDAVVINEENDIGDYDDNDIDIYADNDDKDIDYDDNNADDDDVYYDDNNDDDDENIEKIFAIIDDGEHITKVELVENAEEENDYEIIDDGEQIKKVDLAKDDEENDFQIIDDGEHITKVELAEDNAEEEKDFEIIDDGEHITEVELAKDNVENQSEDQDQDADAVVEPDFAVVDNSEHIDTVLDEEKETAKTVDTKINDVKTDVYDDDVNAFEGFHKVINANILKSPIVAGFIVVSLVLLVLNLFLCLRHQCMRRKTETFQEMEIDDVSESEENDLL